MEKFGIVFNNEISPINALQWLAMFIEVCTTAEKFSSVDLVQYKEGLLPLS